jgi:hypothetical protein
MGAYSCMREMESRSRSYTHKASKANESQMVLLRDFDLLRQNGDSYKTSFPVLGPEEMSALRLRLRQVAIAIAPSLKGPVERIKITLDNEGLCESHYAIVFGYALDGLLWDRLRKNGLFVDTTPDIDHPYWKGAFWAIYPERTGVPGTNQVSQGEAALNLTWTDRVAKSLQALESAPGVPEFLTKVGDGSVPQRPLKTSSGADWMLSRGGKLAIPLVRSRSDDPLYGPSLAIADTVMEAFQKDAEGQAVLASMQGATRSEALLIVTHELIWDIMESLVAKGEVKRPAVLDEAAITPGNLLPLLFVTVR